MVSAELAELQAADVDLKLTGFEEFELEPLLHADWKKGDVAADGEEPHSATDERKIVVTAEQYDVILRAIEAERRDTGEKKMSEGRALERIAERVTA